MNLRKIPPPAAAPPTLLSLLFIDLGGCFVKEGLPKRTQCCRNRELKREDLCVQLIQECLSPAERRQIVEDLRDQLPDICQSIDNLNTALSFLKALGGQTSTSLHEFMSSTLKMKRTLYSHKVCLLYIRAQFFLIWCF